MQVTHLVVSLANLMSDAVAGSSSEKEDSWYAER